MGDIDVKQAGWKLVEVGRIINIREGKDIGKLAAIVEIIDPSRVLIDGPSKKEGARVQRQAIATNKIQLTNLIIHKLPKAAGSGAVEKLWEKAEIDKQWSETSWAKKAEAKLRRDGLSDFDRFKVMRMKKQRRFEVLKTHSKIKASA